MDDNLKPLPINELLDKQFFIPHYQRGYRWTEQQVKQLLDDIDSFIPREISGKPDEKTFYCLQPVVVKLMNEEYKQHHGLTGEWYEVIDGQQRLTTIYLIIQYINDLWAGRQKKDKFSIRYETRDNCAQFLNEIKVNPDNTTVTIDKSNIDYYHISAAYQSIRIWEREYQQNKRKPLDDALFQSKFFANSKIIWYSVSQSEKSSALFERLNLGKIPLTNSELTKALFLSSESFKDLLQEERRIEQYEIARLWDEIEHKLNEPDLKFWSFITNKKRETYETKIELILDMISGKPDGEKDPFYTFLMFIEKQKIAERGKNRGLRDVWDEIEQFYFTLKEWYNNKNYYHKIGFLVAARACPEYKGVNLGQLVKDSMEKTKDLFEEQIDELIRSAVKAELSELRYETHYPQIFNILLLFNVETYRTSKSISEFYPFKQHKDNQWSLEHIHARRSENFDRNKKEPWQIWLDLHRVLLEEKLSDDKNEANKKSIEDVLDKINRFNNEQLTWERFADLFKEMNNLLTIDADGIDKESEGIVNLALLSQPDNAALNNSVFEVKRREIVRLDKEGSFIPVCTRRVFMKYYNEDGTANQHFYWSDSDRKAYLSAIQKTLKNYLTINYIEPQTYENE
jgi:uncharacterized protein with ParB-like and HNH nuclease domain